MPKDRNGDGFTTSWWSRLDGFSTSTTMITYLANASVELTPGLPGWENMAISLDASSPTVVLDTVTGSRLAHFAELDYTSGADADVKAFMIWPSKQLEFSRRYIVAVRDVRNQAGAVIAPSEAFRALRDGIATSDPDIEGRRALYDDIFARLAAAGVERSSLQIAWEFTTGSLEYTTGWMTTIRDDATARVPAEGPSYQIVSVQDEYNDKYGAAPACALAHTKARQAHTDARGRGTRARRHPTSVFRYISGIMSVPHYMTDGAAPNSKLVIDDNNQPVYQVRRLFSLFFCWTGAARASAAPTGPARPGR